MAVNTVLYKLATRMSISSERALSPMDLSGSASKVAERWRQWKRSYEYNYIDGKGITQAERKKSQLLHLAGLEVQDIFEDLVDPGWPKFDLVTDHQALKVIYSRKSKPSAQIERWILRLQPYNYRVCYVSSRKNVVDTLSRLTKVVASNQSQDDDEYVCMVALHAAPVSLKIKKIERVSAEDPELQAVRRCLVEERWNSAPKQFLPVRNELTFIGHVILRGTRIVVPKALRKRVVSLAHEGHQGVVKTKERLQTKVWWWGMDWDAEKLCAECYGCQLVTKHVPPPPV